MNYDPKNNPEDPEYDENAPISILCTGEVKMFNYSYTEPGKTGKFCEYVSHNSYKMPDSVNSFKWDRKIHVGNYLTYNDFNAWKAMISLRHSTAKYDYDQLVGGYRDQFSTWGWGEFASKGAIGIYIPNGIHLVVASGEGGEISIGAGKTFTYSSKNPASYGADGILHMYRQSLFAWR